MANQANGDKHFYELQRPARALYLNATKARGAKLKNGKESEPRFDATLMFELDSPDLVGLRTTIIDAAKEKWPGRDIMAAIKAGQFNVPISDGTAHADKEKAKGKDREVARGKKLFKAASKYQPTLSVILNKAVVDLSTDELIAQHGKQFYPGVNVGVRVSLEPYEAIRDGENDGVSARLYMVLSTNKGERLGGQGKSGAEVFKDYVGFVTDEDPTYVEDDEIAF